MCEMYLCCFQNTVHKPKWNIANTYTETNTDKCKNSTELNEAIGRFVTPCTCYLRIFKRYCQTDRHTDGPTYRPTTDEEDTRTNPSKGQTGYVQTNRHADV